MKKKLKAFSLLEIMMVLAIIGLLLGGLTLGPKLIQKAKLQKTATSILLIKQSLHTIPENEQNNAEIWANIHNYSDTLSPKDQTPSIGGKFIFENKNLILAKDTKEGFLTKEQAEQIKRLIDENVKASDCVIKETPEESKLYILTVNLQ